MICPPPRWIASAWRVTSWISYRQPRMSAHRLTTTPGTHLPGRNSMPWKCCRWYLRCTQQATRSRIRRSPDPWYPYVRRKGIPSSKRVIRFHRSLEVTDWWPGLPTVRIRSLGSFGKRSPWRGNSVPQDRHSMPWAKRSQCRNPTPRQVLRQAINAGSASLHNVQTTTMQSASSGVCLNMIKMICIFEVFGLGNFLYNFFTTSRLSWILFLCTLGNYNNRYAKIFLSRFEFIRTRTSTKNIKQYWRT